ncbi:MAG: D-alanyl-D-alanine carboxypeptidase family protein [Flavonifractor plautii]
MKGTLYLVNRAHPLPEEPAAEDLASVRSGQTEVRLHQRAKVMLDQLLAAVDGAGTIIPVSGYRPQTEQQAIWETPGRARQSLHRDLCGPPGCSEHQTGLAIDLARIAGGGLPLPRLPRLRPLQAAPPGRRLRLSSATPRGRRMSPASDTSRVHFRYVGWPHAKLMEEHLVLEEYLEWLHDFPLGGEPLRFRGLGRLFELYYLPAWAADSLTLPADVPCQRGDTNEGGVVLTLWRDAG